MRDGTRNMTKIETLHQRLSVHYFGTQRKSKTETNQTSLPYFSFVFLQSAPNRGRAHIKTNKEKDKNKI